MRPCGLGAHHEEPGPVREEQGGKSEEQPALSRPPPRQMQRGGRATQGNCCPTWFHGHRIAGCLNLPRFKVRQLTNHPGSRACPGPGEGTQGRTLT